MISNRISQNGSDIGFFFFGRGNSWIKVDKIEVIELVHEILGISSKGNQRRLGFASTFRVFTAHRVWKEMKILIMIHLSIRIKSLFFTNFLTNFVCIKFIARG